MISLNLVQITRDLHVIIKKMMLKKLLIRCLEIKKNYETEPEIAIEKYGYESKYKHIAIEGPVGVGKTTFSRKLAQKFNARLILEQPEGNPFLPNFYRDSERYAFQTQVFFLASRYKQLKELFQQSLFEKTTVVDFLFEKDRIFATLTLTENELNLYNRLEPILFERLPKPDFVIFLRANVDVLMERIKLRGREYEKYLQPDYLERLCKAYAEYFRHYEESPVLTVDTDEIDLASDESVFNELITQMNEQKSGMSHFVPSAL